MDQQTRRLIDEGLDEMIDPHDQQLEELLDRADELSGLSIERIEKMFPELSISEINTAFYGGSERWNKEIASRTLRAEAMELLTLPIETIEQRLPGLSREEITRGLTRVRNRIRQEGRAFIDPKTDLPNVSGNFGNELREAVKADRLAEKYVNSQEHYSITVPNWEKTDKHLANAARMIAEALKKGKTGIDFRTAAPYFIGKIGGVEIVFWPARGSSRSAYPTKDFEKQIADFLPEDSKWMVDRVVDQVREQLFSSNNSNSLAA